MKNPIVEGWYADPEVRFYDGKFWVYVTQSYTGFAKQLNIDAFSSSDGIHWDKHKNIIDMSGFSWIWGAVWAPTIIEKDNKYYLIFASNDIQNSNENGGLEISVSSNPEGPFKSLINKPLLSGFVNGAQPIDAHLFEDQDKQVFLLYGGWKHCNITRLNSDMNGFIPFEDNNIFREITPPNYVEAPCMFKKNNKYHFMWSAGDWAFGDYHVNHSISDSIFGPFEEYECILESDKDIAEGPGHNGFIKSPLDNNYYIFYHRRIIGDKEAGHRILCKEQVFFDEFDKIIPIKMT